MGTDVIKCRRRALEFNQYELPSFCVLDDIQKCDQKLGDLSLVTRKYRCFFTQFGYTGPGWVAKPLTERLMHVG